LFVVFFEKTSPLHKNEKYVDENPDTDIPALERYYPELVCRRLEFRAFMADPSFQCG
jgi:hypothetical protein